MPKPPFTRRAWPGRWARTGANVAASLTTALTGTNNDLVFTAVATGPDGNNIRVRYVAPGTASQALSVVVSGSDVTVNLATNGSSVVTSTATLVRNAVNASVPAQALLTAANAAGNDGTGVVTALAYTNLSGGTKRRTATGKGWT